MNRPDRPRRTGRGRDLVPAVALLVLCAVLFYVTTTFETVPPAFAQGMQASAMPRLILGLIAVLTVAMAWQGRGGGGEVLPRVPGISLATGAVVIVAAVLFPVLGVTLTILLSCIVIPALWGERRPKVLVPFAIGVPLGIHLIFVILLRLRLPQGILEGVL